MSMDKIANLQLETTSQYQSLSKLNVQFWNQDRKTAPFNWSTKFNLSSTKKLSPDSSAMKTLTFSSLKAKG